MEKLNTLMKVKDQFNQGVPIEFLFFWGHLPSSCGVTTSSCLSQWWKKAFSVEGVSYCCMEQYMMAMKAHLFGDYTTEKAIMDEADPREIKRLGKQVQGFISSEWDLRKYGIVVKGNLAKFSQNDELYRFLMKTGDAVLVEASPSDTVWGIGMGSNTPDVCDPNCWKGSNLLGFALMDVRYSLN